MINKKNCLLGLILTSFVLFLIGCSTGLDGGETAVSEHENELATSMLLLPELEAIELNGKRLKVVATTSIIGDVVAQVGGEAIDLTVLMQPGQDPHSYEPGAQDLTAVATAHIIFVNGWDLEESLARDLEEIGTDSHIVAISANIEPLAFAENGHNHEEDNEPEDVRDEQELSETTPHSQSRVDPHVWLSVQHVKQWVENVETVLTSLDETNMDMYARNATAYITQLDELEAYAAEQMASIPEENRFLVTNHDAFGYLAHEFDLTVLGTVIPGMSTLAESSASDLARLIEEMEAHGVCTLFTETTVSDSLSQTVATELDSCAEVQVLQLFTGAVGVAGSGTDNYMAMYRANIDTIVAGLQ